MAAEKVKNYCFGIDVGGTTIKLGLFDRAGNVLDKWEIKTRTEENGKYILPDAAQAVLTKMSDRGLKKGRDRRHRDRCSGTGRQIRHRSGSGQSSLGQGKYR